jgi:arylsulfatase A-like enzyme
LHWRRHIGAGILVGFVAGAVEAVAVNRTGFFFIPYAAFAYAILTAVGFVLLALLGGAIKRDLAPLGFGASVAFFIVLEAAFWLNKKSPLPPGSGINMIINGAVLAVGFGIGVWAGLAYRRRSRGHGLFRPAAAILAVVTVGLAVFFGTAYRATRPGTNCILISVDALRPDHLSCYGYHRETSPNIDRLAREGVLFLRAFTPSPGSTGGHASMLTGLHTLSHGAYLNEIRLPDEAKTAAEVCRDNGYSTAAFTRNWYISTALGFGQGFDCFLDQGYGEVLRRATPQLFMRGLALTQIILRLRLQPGHPSDLDIRDAIHWMRFRQGYRFFLFLHIMDTHSPYIPPPEFAGRFGDARPDAAFIESLHEKSLRHQLSPEEIGFLVDRYDEEILTADWKIGLLLEELRRLGLDRNTMIVVTADHGEVMGESEGKQFGHGTLDYGSLRIPLIMWLPAKIPAGQRVEGTVQSIDILPTMTDLLGLRDDQTRQGLSLVSRADMLTAERPAFATGDLLAREEYTVIASQWQYVILGDKAFLYNLGDDPYAASNVIGEYPAVADSLRGLLTGWMDKSLDEAVVPFSIEGRAVTPGQEATQRLKALGYIQ